MGARQSLGLFLAPLNATTGLGIAAISLAMAVVQFMWGAVQPIAGAVAYRFGPRRVLRGGLFLHAAGSALTPFMNSTWGLVISLGLLSAVGSGACRFSVLIGVATTRLLIALYLVAPRTDLTFYIFAAGLGFTWLATVPPTTAVVGKLFGVRYFGTPTSCWPTWLHWSICRSAKRRY
jgi:MFS family permease